MRFDLTDLRLFCEVTDAGSITRGAERCALALAAASTRIRNMEEALGAPLLERSRQGVTPTPAATMAIFGAVRAASVNRPYGPSIDTRVPTGTVLMRLLPAPRSRTVIRAVVSVGTADSEIGCECHQVRGVQKRQMKNWPPAVPSERSLLPVRWMDVTPGAI